MTLRTGSGDAGDNVVRAGSDIRHTAEARGGDNVLIGDASANWLVGGPGDNVMHGGGGADEFRFYGSHVGGDKSDAILDLDFTGGDRIVLGGYEAGTFGGRADGANVFADGTAVILTSQAGLESLAAARRT